MLQKYRGRPILLYQKYLHIFMLFLPSRLSGADLKREDLKRFDEIHDAIQTLSESIQLLEQVHVDPQNNQTLLDAYDRAIKAIIQIDPHSSYFPPSDKERFLSSIKGEFGGIGVQLTFVEDGLFIVKVLEGPAKKAGIREGDIIEAIDDHKVGSDLEESLMKLSGDPQTVVKIQIYRPYIPSKTPKSKKEYELEHNKTGNPSLARSLEFRIKREVIKVSPVQTEPLEGGVLWLKLNLFTPDCDGEVEKALKKAREAGQLNGLIFDVRDNPGGALDAVIRISDLFIEKGPIVSTHGRRPEYQKVYYASQRTPFRNLPIVLLINQGSASASELLAAALQDHQRALLVGQRTFKKGSFQDVFQLKRGAIKITAGHFFSPAGRRISDDGVVPDIAVGMKEHDEDPFILKYDKSEKGPQVWLSQSPLFHWDEIYKRGIEQKPQIFDPQSKVAYYNILRMIGRKEFRQKLELPNMQSQAPAEGSVSLLTNPFE